MLKVKVLSENYQALSPEVQVLVGVTESLEVETERIAAMLDVVGEYRRNWHRVNEALGVNGLGHEVARTTKEIDVVLSVAIDEIQAALRRLSEVEASLKNAGIKNSVDLEGLKNDEQ